MSGMGSTTSSGSHTKATAPFERAPRGKTLGQLSMWQMLKLVLFAAVGSALLAPGLRVAETQGHGLGAILLFELVLIPLAWTLLAIVIVRKGPFREWLILALLWLSVTMALLVFGTLLINVVWQILSHAGAGGWRPSWEDTVLVLVCGGLLALAASIVFLTRRVVPRQCPACRRRARVWMRTIQAPRLGGPTAMRSQCLRCGAMFEQMGEHLELLAATGSTGS